MSGPLVVEVRHGAPEPDELAALVVVLALRMRRAEAGGVVEDGLGAAVWHRFAAGRPGPHWRAAGAATTAWRTAA